MGSGPSWPAELAAAVAGAPAWVRDLVSSDLHIGGFTNVRLDVPVLDAASAPGADRAEGALLFLAAGALLRAAPVARVHCGRGPLGATLAGAARRRLRGIVARVEDEDLALMRYFDLHLNELARVDATAGARLLRALRAALAAATPP